MRAFAACLLLCLVACQDYRLHVRELVTPEYPREARVRNIQGTVKVDVLIGPDGKVIVADGSGAHPILVEAATRNVRQWVFGPFPPVCEFPINHTVTFVYKLEGPPASVVLGPMIRTYLPDRIELQSRTFESDLPPATAPATTGERKSEK